MKTNASSSTCIITTDAVKYSQDERTSFFGFLVLVILDELIKSQEGAQPSGGVVALQESGDLFHDFRPFARVIVLHDMLDENRQLNSVSGKGKQLKWNPTVTHP